MYMGNRSKEELAVWYLGVQEELTVLSWGEFKTVFLRRALLTGYLWDALAHIRNNHQGSHSYIDWSMELQQAQAEIGAVALSDLNLVREMLFNMDPELRCELRQAVVLKGSGYHEEEMETVSVGCVVKARCRCRWDCEEVHIVQVNLRRCSPHRQNCEDPHLNYSFCTLHLRDLNHHDY
jgi:hypothetical protein